MIICKPKFSPTTNLVKIYFPSFFFWPIIHVTSEKFSYIFKREKILYTIPVLWELGIESWIWYAQYAWLFNKSSRWSLYVQTRLWSNIQLGEQNKNRWIVGDSLTLYGPVFRRCQHQAKYLDTNNIQSCIRKRIGRTDKSTTSWSNLTFDVNWESSLNHTLFYKSCHQQCLQKIEKR